MTVLEEAAVSGGMTVLENEAGLPYEGKFAGRNQEMPPVPVMWCVAFPTGNATLQFTVYATICRTILLRRVVWGHMAPTGHCQIDAGHLLVATRHVSPLFPSASLWLMASATGFW
jgi:hypothetical protein